VIKGDKLIFDFTGIKIYWDGLKESIESLIKGIFTGAYLV
jgi:hypothetical protein